MTSPLKINPKMMISEAGSLRKHYEGIAHDTLVTIGRRKFMIAAIIFAALLLATAALVLIGPRYTAEALIQLNFSNEEPVARGGGQPAVSMDPVALVDGAARVIRSPTTAGAVVARLGLDKDPYFARESTLWRGLSSARILIGLTGVAPSPRDLAIKTLMAMVAVNHEPRSYLISIGVTAGDPARAAALANTVALEYLRGQMLDQLTEEQTAAAREFAQLSSVYRGTSSELRFCAGEARKSANSPERIAKWRLSRGCRQTCQRPVVYRGSRAYDPLWTQYPDRSRIHDRGRLCSGSLAGFAP